MGQGEAAYALFLQAALASTFKTVTLLHYAQGIAAQASLKQLNVAFGEGCERSSARPAEEDVNVQLRCYTMRKGLKRKARNGA